VVPRVVVLGGGFGGLEAAFYLRDKVKDAAAVTVVSDQESFLFKPNTIYIPFGMDPEKLKIPLRPALARQEITFVHGRATAVDAHRKTVTVQPAGPNDATGATAATQTLPYDYLVLATGAGMRPAEVPGLAEHALTIWTPSDMLRLRAAYGRLVEAGARRERRRVLFVVPPNNKCAGPLYEMVQMLDTWLRRKKVRQYVDITWTTYEAGYIQAFGPRLHEAVLQEFTLRGIGHHTRYVVERVEPGVVRYATGESLPYDLLISFPPYVASTPFAGLPVDDRGFVQTTLGTRQVQGLPDVYAVGDAGDFPVKQAFLAFLQADAAAEHLAARIRGETPQIDFEPTSMCVMEQFNTATFAQVPLRLTGDAARPIEVDPAKWAAYKVGSSILWRLGKWLLGVYLPWRFRAGKPFHAGLPWRLMDWGLKLMSLLLASATPAPTAAPAPAPVRTEITPATSSGAGASLEGSTTRAAATKVAPAPNDASERTKDTDDGLESEDTSQRKGVPVHV
jgi:sulfide:quinone oxidoreductase